MTGLLGCFLVRGAAGRGNRSARQRPVVTVRLEPGRAHLEND